MKMRALILICALIMAGCGVNENPKAENEMLKDEHVIADTITLVQNSQLSFDEALADIRENKKEEAASIIKKALEQLSAEKESIKIPDVKAKMGNSMSVIRQIADSLEVGKDVNIKTLRRTFSRAELLLARLYLINIEIPEAIDKTYVAMNKTVQLLEAGILHGDDEMKQDAGTIVADTKSLLQTAKGNEEQHKDELNIHSDRLKSFLEKHTR